MQKEPECDVTGINPCPNCRPDDCRNKLVKVAANTPAGPEFRTSVETNPAPTKAAPALSGNVKFNPAAKPPVVAEAALVELQGDDLKISY